MRLEPNALVAISTACALALLVCSAAVFGEQGHIAKYLIVAALVPVALIPLNRWWRKRMGWQTPVLVHADAPGSVVWAAIFPAIVGLAAAVPFFFPYKDYGLLVLIGSIWFGLTLDSALRANSR